MSGMPPPPPRLPGDLRRAALAAAAAAAGSGDGQQQHRLQQQQQQQPTATPRDARLALPLPWADYFERQQRVHCSDRQATFNVYSAGTSGPVVLCLHGGGYTGLTWALLARQLSDRCRIVAPDLRGHGLTETAEDADLAAATLAADVVALWQALFRSGSSGSDGSGSGAQLGSQQQPQQQENGAEGAAPLPQPTALPPTVLVGHSMGGAIAVHAAALAGIPSLAGVVVIDVVEGTALASLPHMAAVLAKRPRRFASLQQAVDWALDTGMVKRQEAAHISLPSMLHWQQQQQGAGPTGSSSASGNGSSNGSAVPPLASIGGLAPLAEEEEEGDGDGELPQQEQEAQQQQQQEQRPPAAASNSSRAGGWVWRTPLERSEPFWEDWYSGLSDLFLKLPAPKVLVLVGTDRLDRPLTIGQMQGRFQPVLLPGAGHAVQEDEPERTAEALATFIKRFRIGEPPLQIPRPAAGVPPVLPVAMGPAFVPQQSQKPG